MTTQRHGCNLVRYRFSERRLKSVPEMQRNWTTIRILHDLEQFILHENSGGELELNESEVYIFREYDCTFTPREQRKLEKGFWNLTWIWLLV